MTVNETFLSFSFNICCYYDDLLEKPTSTFFISTDYPEFLGEISEDKFTCFCTGKHSFWNVNR